VATNELRKRANWQTLSGAKAAGAEVSFFDAFTQAFAGTDYRIRQKPKDFKDIYVKVQLPPALLEQTFKPSYDYSHGVAPDYAIDNIRTGKTLYVEVKRQDGWVEGKDPSAGRGNAHERSCKFFTPGLRKVLSNKGKLGEDVLPFWVVFLGDIARDPKRTREVTLWYEGVEDHYFFWSDATNPDPLIEHFEERLMPYLVGQKPAPRVLVPGETAKVDLGAGQVEEVPVSSDRIEPDNLL
jgi:hypothetical protein